MPKKSNRTKTSKPLTGRKAVQESNKNMMDFFSNQLMDMRQEMAAFEKRVADSNRQLWNNQQQEKQGLRAAEDHVVLLRRVLNDALGGTTRVSTIERRSQTDVEETEKAQNVDWGWYAEQLHYSEDRDAYMRGEVLTEDEISDRAAAEKIKQRNNIVLYAVGKAVEFDEPKLREVYDAGGLEEHLKQFMPQGHEWQDEMSEIAPGTVERVLSQRDAAKAQRAKVDLARTRALLKVAAQKAIAGGCGGMDSYEGRLKALQGSLPTAVAWTEEMDGMAEEVVLEAVSEHAERAAAEEKAKFEENDPKEVEEAKQDLLDATEKFGNEAGKVIELINEGREEEARVEMDKLEQQVKDKEAEADANRAPHIPDGAAVFGG